MQKQKTQMDEEQSENQSGVTGYSEEEDPFTNIDELQNHGINGGDINKLKAAGLCTVISCLMTTKKEMLNIKGITEAKAEKIFEAAGKIETLSFKTGLQISEMRKGIKRISTGSPSLDMLL